MSRSRWLLCCLAVSVLAVPRAQAAWWTDVIDAADDKWVGGERFVEDAYDMNLGVRFSGGIEQGLISRENPSTAPDLAKELRYRTSHYQLNFNLDLAIYHDFGLYVDLPLVLNKTNRYSFSTGTSTTNSSVWNGNPADPANILFFAPPADFTHSGLGDINVGLRWSPLNDERDPSVATWTLGFSYQIPSAKTWGADGFAGRADLDADNKVTGLAPGDGAHRLNFSLGMSKRMFMPKSVVIDREAKRRGYMDPYFQLWYSLPFVGGNSLPADQSDRLEHAGTTSQLKPSHLGGFVTGFEVVPLEDVSLQRRIAIDVGAYGNYVSEGRGYTQMSDALGELNYHENYLNAGVHLNFLIQAAEFIQFRAGVSLGHQSAHFLTTESAGDDKNGDDQITAGTDWVSPYWDPRYDQIGGRFRVEETAVFTYFAQLMLTF